MNKMDVAQLARQRLQSWLAEAIYYWRLIGSSGLLFTVVVLLIVGMMYYEDLIEWIPEQTPVIFILSLIYTYLLTRTPQRTFLKEADLLFLTPVEEKMDRYFQVVFRYNVLLQSCGLFIVLFLLAPVYIDRMPEESHGLWTYYLVPLILKGWNLQSGWSVLKLHNDRLIRYHALLRGGFNFLFVYWLLAAGRFVFLPFFVLIIVLFYVYERRVNAQHAYNWLRLIELERHLQSRFYSFCNAFVDVPHLQSKVRKRRWLTWLSGWLPFDRSQAYRYVYTKTFFRANDYLGIYLRLSIIGALLVYLLDDPWSRWLIYLLFLFLAGTQLRALWRHHQQRFWTAVYPVAEEEGKRAFMWLNGRLLGMQAIIMFIPLLVKEPLGGQNVILLAVGLLFAYGYSYVWLKKKWFERKK